MSTMNDEYYSGVNDIRNNSVNTDSPERNGRIIVRNISFKATKETLKEHFSKFGTVNEVNLLKKPDGRIVGCGFVHFEDVTTAEKAIKATHTKPFLDRPIYVDFAVPKKNYVQNLQDKDARTRFNTSENGHKASVKIEILGASKKPKDQEKNKIRINRNARLILRNVSFKATEETLKEHFEPYGQVLEVKLLKKPDGKLVGCAFVHFKNVPMAKKALLNTNMKPFLGRPISVDWAVAKNKYMQHQMIQQIELEENVKQESDSDDEQKPFNVSDEVKAEVKSESDSDADSDSGDSDGDDDDESNQESEEEDQSDDDEEDEEQDEEEDEEQDEKINIKEETQRIKLNDAEDGCTVFITNIPFSIDNDQLKEFAEKTGPVKYALICMDRMTEHSKGSGFVKFANQEHADAFLSLPADQLKLDGQVMQVKPALKKENLQKGNKKEAKDNRNLYLVKEGVVVAGTKAAVGVSASDMSKRLALERSKTQMLKNLNRFVSRYRLVVSNLPAHFDDSKLRRICVNAGDKRATVTECRVMRDLRTPPGRDGKHPSKGYGFVMFTRHEDALACIRKLNNNPDIFDKNNRPIVSFSIEDRTALNARKKRLEKSIANNPLTKNNENEGNNASESNKKNRKRKSNTAPDESYAAAKRRKFGKNKFNQNQNTESSNDTGGRFVKKPRNTHEEEEYTGLTAKQGTQHKMRSNHKLRAQADIHRQTVKMEKKKSMRSQRFKMAAKERVKQPKQKINKNPNKKRNKKFKPQSKYEMLRG